MLWLSEDHGTSERKWWSGSGPWCPVSPRRSWLACCSSPPAPLSSPWRIQHPLPLLPDHCRPDTQHPANCTHVFQPAVPPYIRLLWGAAQDVEAGHQWGQRRLRHALTLLSLALWIHLYKRRPELPTPVHQFTAFIYNLTSGFSAESPRLPINTLSGWEGIALSPWRKLGLNRMNSSATVCT